MTRKYIHDEKKSSSPYERKNKWMPECDHNYNSLRARGGNYPKKLTLKKNLESQ